MAIRLSDRALKWRRQASLLMGGRIKLNSFCSNLRAANALFIAESPRLDDINVNLASILAIAANYFWAETAPLVAAMRMLFYGEDLQNTNILSEEFGSDWVLD